MPRMMKRYTTTDEYIASCQPQIRSVLKSIRATIKKNAPGANEAIRYGMPTFQYYGNLVFFAVFDDHYSFFPTSTAIIVFKDELKKYDCSKGTIRFPLDSKIPLGLIGRIVKYRASQNREWFNLKNKNNLKNKKLLQKRKAV